MHTRILVLVASHFKNEKRYLSIQESIKSIVKNTVKPDCIYISYSSEKEVDENKWREISKNVPIYIFNQQYRMLQFEHYNFLSQFVQKNDIVCFLDDDDLFTSTKIHVIRDHFRTYPQTQILRHYSSSFFIDIDNIYNSKSNKEYFCMVMIGHLMKKWFKTIYPNVIESCAGLTDISFGDQFNETNPLHFQIENVLYYQRFDPSFVQSYNK